MTVLCRLVGPYAHDHVDAHERAAMAAAREVLPQSYHPKLSNKSFRGGERGQGLRPQAGVLHLLPRGDGAARATWVSLGGWVGSGWWLVVDGSRRNGSRWSE
eukprot:7389205-Prymnesium_polylepis.1